MARLVSYPAIYLMCLFGVQSLCAHGEEHPVPLGKNPDPSKCVECHSDKSQGKYVHTAIAMGCTTCHSVTSAKGATLISLVSPANDFCFTCHEKYSDKVLHGPYAQGNCVACHSPHASNYPDQVLADRQDLCLGCHTRERLKMNRRQDTVTTPWGETLTLNQMQGWQFINLNKNLSANHPVEGHPVTGANTALGKGPPDISCLSCHAPHHSKQPNLMPPNMPSETALCKSCHKF